MFAERMGLDGASRKIELRTLYSMSQRRHVDGGHRDNRDKEPAKPLPISETDEPQKTNRTNLGKTRRSNNARPHNRLISLRFSSLYLTF